MSVASQGVEAGANAYIGFQTGNWSALDAQGAGLLVGGVFSHATGRMAIALRGVPGRMGKAARNARAGALGDAAGNVVSDATAGVYCGKSN